MTAGFAPVESTDWEVAFTIPDTQYLAAIPRVRNLIAGIGVLALLAGMLINLLLARSVTRQLGTEPSTIRRIADRVAAGDLVIDFASFHVRNGTGAYAAVKGMVESLTDMVASI